MMKHPCEFADEVVWYVSKPMDVEEERGIVEKMRVQIASLENVLRNNDVSGFVRMIEIGQTKIDTPNSEQYG